MPRQWISSIERSGGYKNIIHEREEWDSTDNLREPQGAIPQPLPALAPQAGRGEKRVWGSGGRFAATATPNPKMGKRLFVKTVNLRGQKKHSAGEPFARRGCYRKDDYLIITIKTDDSPSPSSAGLAFDGEGVGGCGFLSGDFPRNRWNRSHLAASNCDNSSHFYVRDSAMVRIWISMMRELGP
jgi:hypothetical protein